MNRTRVKICGIRTAEMAATAVDAGADAVGFVVDVPASPRTITMDEALAIAQTLPKQVISVAVMQDPPVELAQRWKGTWVQLHGAEGESVVERIARTKHVIKGFRFDPDEVRRWNACSCIEGLLVDGSAGGGAAGFDHAALAAMMPEIVLPIIIAGGLTAENVGKAIHAVRPFAVDVSSGVERAPGEKDPELIRRFCQAARAASSC